MITFLIVLVVLAMLATLGILFAGMFGLVRGDGNAERSNRLMRWRVMMQFVAIVLFGLLMLLLKR